MTCRAVIFDLDGTLVDSFPGIHRSLVEAMTGTGVEPWDFETTARHVGHGVHCLVESAVGPEKKESALNLFRRHYAATCLETTIPLPSVPDTLHRLRTLGFKLAVASNKPLEFTLRILQHLRLVQYLDFTAGPEQVLRPKPFPDMINLVCEQLQVPKTACLYVGDMVLDAETAKRAGVSCVLVASGARSQTELRQEVDVPVLHELSDLLRYLKVTPGEDCV